LCPTEYTIDLPEDTISLLVMLEKEGVRDLILAMSFGKSIHDRLNAGEPVWISRPLDSSPTRDVEGMLWEEDELRTEGRLPGTWYIGVINKEPTPQDYTIVALVETREENQPPQADFSFSPSSPTTDDTVQFTDRSSDPDGEVVEWEWDFGDGSTSTSRNPTHRYTRAGTYTVELTVTDDGGLTDTRSRTITVREANHAPTADAGPDQTVQVGETVQLDGSGSSDPDGDPLSFRWSFVERPSGSRAALSNPTSIRTTFVPDLAGRYVVELTVDDGRGGSDTDIVMITAEEAPPPTYEYEGSFTRGELGRLEVPQEIKRQLPEPARYLERPNTTHEGRQSDSLTEVGLKLSESTGTIFGTPISTGRFQFLIEVQHPDGRTAAFLWAIVIIVEPEEQPPGLSVEPESLSFRAQVGGPNPGAQELVLTNTSDKTLTWEASIEGTWLFLNIVGGTLRPGEKITLQAWVEISGLAAGTHQGRITFSAPRNPEIPPLTVPVTLTIEGPAPPPGEGELLALKFIKLEFLEPEDWERTQREGCVLYTNISAEPSPIRVTLPDGSTQEFEIPAGKEVIVCGDVVHIDTRGPS
jgi:PKD repeat protein